MEEITFKDIEKAMKQLKKYGTTPAKFYTSESHAKKVIEKAKESGVYGKGSDGCDDVLGMKVITRQDIDDRTCYISET